MYTAAGFEAGVIAWCHGVQVVDDRPVFETRCALLSCSQVVVWPLFIGPFSKGLYSDICSLSGGSQCKKGQFPDILEQDGSQAFL